MERCQIMMKLVKPVSANLYNFSRLRLMFHSSIMAESPTILQYFIFISVNINKIYVDFLKLLFFIIYIFEEKNC